MSAALVSVVAMGSAVGCGGQDPPGPTAKEREAKEQEVAATNRAEQVYEANQQREGEIERLKAQVRRARRERAAVRAQESRDPEAQTGAAGHDAGLLSDADRASFERLEHALGGRSGVAVSAVGIGRPVSHVGSFQTAVAWSTSKVPVAMASIAASTGDSGDLTRAITASDNAAAEALWAGLGGGEQAAAAADAQLQSAGDETTHMEAAVQRAGYTPFGQTVWTLPNQTSFTAGMVCSEPGRTVLGLMGRTIAAQRWGLGATGWSAEIKGGWGPGASPGRAGGYIDRQMGVLTSGGKRLAVTIMTEPSTGTHEAGTANLTQIARWVVDHVDRRALTSQPSC